MNSITDKLAVGDKIVLMDGNDGTIRYIGKLKGYNGKIKKGIYYGIDLKEKNGSHDGFYGGQQYFFCALNHGRFVQKDEIVPKIKKEVNKPHHKLIKKQFYGININKYDKLQQKIFYLLLHWLRLNIMNKQNIYSFLLSEASIKLISIFIFDRNLLNDKFMSNFFKLNETTYNVKGIQYKSSHFFQESRGCYDQSDWTLQLFLDDNKCYYSIQTEQREYGYQWTDGFEGYGTWNTKNDDCISIKIHKNGHQREFSSGELKRMGFTYIY